MVKLLIPENRFTLQIIKAGFEGAVRAIKNFSLSASRRSAQDLNQLSLSDEAGRVPVLSKQQTKGYWRR